MSQTRDVFQAIADPTRRQIISMLANKPLHVNAIAGQFHITRQAVSLHLQFLSDCGLITFKQQGRERLCEARLEKLDEVSDWVQASKTVWLQRFKSLERFLEKSEKSNNSHKKKSHAKKRKPKAG